MKKILLSILTLSMVITVSAQDYSQKSVRDAKRTQRQEAIVEQLTAALKSRSFTFSASYLMPEFEGPGQMLNQWDNYVSVYPGYMEVTLPYASASPNTSVMMPKRIAINTSAFTFWEDMNTGSQWTLVFQTEWDNVKYVFHLSYDSTNGSAKLTLVPNMGNTVIYTGTIQAH